MNDLALHRQRFNEGISPELTFPVTETPKRNNTLHSPRVGNSHGLKPFDITKYKQYLDEIIEVRLRCAKNEYAFDFLSKHYPKAWGKIPSKLPEPLVNAGVTIDNVKTCADIVRMDTPVDLGLFILRWLAGKGALKPKQGAPHFQFIETFPAALAEMSKKINEALERAFEAKYYFGIARPAQVYEFIYKKSGANIYEYKHPTHPSYPAGHGAAAGATAQFFYDYFDLETEDWIAIRYAAYLFAQYRSFAGVHYAVDNLAGLQVGGLDVGYATV